MSQSSLNHRQRTLQALALKQLQAASETLERLKLIPASRADSEALADACELLERGTDCLRNWFGTEPPGK